MLPLALRATPSCGLFSPLMNDSFAIKSVSCQQRFLQHLPVIAAQHVDVTNILQETLKRFCDTFKWIAVFPDLLEHRPPPPPPLWALPVVYSRLPLASHLFSPDKPLPFKAYSSLQASQEAWDCQRVVECFNQERLQALMCHAVSSAEPRGKSGPSRLAVLSNIVSQSLTTSLMTALTLHAVVFVNRGWWGGGNDSLVTPDGCFPKLAAAAWLLSASSPWYSLRYWKEPNQQPHPHAPPSTLRFDWLFLPILKCGDVSSDDKENKNNGSACLKRGAIGAIRLAATTPKLGCLVLGIAVLAQNESGLRSGDWNFDFSLFFFFFSFKVDRGE